MVRELLRGIRLLRAAEQQVKRSQNGWINILQTTFDQLGEEWDVEYDMDVSIQDKDDEIYFVFYRTYSIYYKEKMVKEINIVEKRKDIVI